MEEQDFKKAILQTMQYFLATNMCNIFVVISSTFNRTIQIKSHHNTALMAQFPQPLVMDWQDVENFLLLPGYDAVEKLSEADGRYFNFFDIQFDWGLEKKFFSFAMAALPDEHIEKFINWMMMWGDISFVTFKQLSSKPERFWLVFDMLTPLMTNGQLLDVYTALKSLPDHQKIDEKMFSFFKARAELLKDERQQLGMFNAMTNTLGMLQARKYTTFLSPSVLQSIDKKDFIKCIAEHIMCIEIDQYSFYHRVQFYPMGGFGETVFQKIIEKCLKEIIESQMTPIKKFVFVNHNEGNKFLHVFVYCDDSSLSKQQLIDLLQQCCKFLLTHQNLNKNWTAVNLTAFIMHQLLQQQIIEDGGRFIEDPNKFPRGKL